MSLFQIFFSLLCVELQNKKYYTNSLRSENELVLAIFWMAVWCAICMFAVMTVSWWRGCWRRTVHSNHKISFMVGCVLYVFNAPLLMVAEGAFCEILCSWRFATCSVLCHATKEFLYFRNDPGFTTVQLIARLGATVILEIFVSD